MPAKQSGRNQLVPHLAFAGVAVLAVGAGVAAVTIHSGSAPAAESSGGPASSIMVAGQLFDVGRPVVLWKDPQGFDAYQVRCIDQRGGCCDSDSKRYGARRGLDRGSIVELQEMVSLLVL